MAGLFGYGGINGAFGAQAPAGLLGKNFDPKIMRQQQLKQGLLQAGIAMLQNGKGNFGEVLGNSFAGGLQGANQAGINYKNDAMGYQQLETQMAEQKRQEQEYQDKEKQKAAIMQMISEDTPENQQLAMTNPQAYAELRMKQHFEPAGGGGGNFGNMIWGVGPDGKDGVFLPPKEGNVATQLQFPEGFAPLPGVQFLDNGTFYDPRNKRTGQPQAGVAPIPKDIAGVQTQEEIGTNTGKKIAAAPNDIQAADNALDIIESLRTDPNKSRGTGLSSIFNAVPGTAGKSFQKKVDQATAGAFMTGIQAMRGMGALSDAEGRRASDAVARMDTATTEEEFDNALNDYERIVLQARRKAEKFMGGTATAPTQNQAPRLKYNPATGELE